MFQSVSIRLVPNEYNLGAVEVAVTGVNRSHLSNMAGIQGSLAEWFLLLLITAVITSIKHKARIPLS